MHCALRNGPNQAQAKHTPAMVLKATQPDVELQVAAATPGPEAPFWTQRARRKCTHRAHDESAHTNQSETSSSVDQHVDFMARWQGADVSEEKRVK